MTLPALSPSGSVKPQSPEQGDTSLLWLLSSKALAQKTWISYRCWCISVTNKLVIYFQKSDVHTARNNSFFFFKEKINCKHALVISLNSMVSKTCDLLPCFLPAFPQGLLEAWLAHMIIPEYMALKAVGKLEAHRELGRVRGERLLHLISIISHSSISGPLGSGSRT